MNITDKTGALITILDVTDKDDLMIINKSGILIRIAVSDLRVMGRATQGVRLINLREDSIAAVTKVAVDEEEEGEEHKSDKEYLANQEPDDTEVVEDEEPETEEDIPEEESEEETDAKEEDDDK
jgi:DNA gyrase subunit A